MTFVETKYYTCFESPNELKLESGHRLGSITIAYETYGQLNKKKDNAILICHALSGDAHVAFKYKGKEKSDGWWDNYVGPGKAIDTDKNFIICSNTLGGCKGTTGPSSTNPKTKKPYGTDFPIITIGDMVHVQKALIDYLGIPKLKSVIGGSMGGMQALEWIAIYPDMVASIIPIAATGQVSPLAVAFDAVGRSAILTDSNFHKGKYYAKDHPKTGLALARMIGHITYLSEESIDQKFGRRLQKKIDYGYDFSTDFQVESYLQYQGDKFVNRFDSNSYLYLTKAISYFDMPKKYGSMEKAFEKSDARFLVISITSDWLYTSKQSKDIARSLMKLNKEVTYVEVDTHYGHDAFLIENPGLMDIISIFLEKIKT